MLVRPGVRLCSVTCSTEVVVIRGVHDVDIRCGGAAMVSADTEPAERRAIDPSFSDGTLLGKRYSDDDAGIEVLCVKPGEGSLSLGTTVIAVRPRSPSRPRTDRSPSGAER